MNLTGFTLFGSSCCDDFDHHAIGSLLAISKESRAPPARQAALERRLSRGIAFNARQALTIAAQTGCVVMNAGAMQR